MPIAFPATAQTEHGIFKMTLWMTCHWLALGSAYQKCFIQIFNLPDLIIQEIGSSVQKSTSEHVQTTDLSHHSYHPERLSNKTRKRLKLPQACLCHKHPVISKPQPKRKTGSSPISDRLNSRFIIAVMKPQGGWLTRRDSAQLHLAHCESPKVSLPLLSWALLLASNSNAPFGN